MRLRPNALMERVKGHQRNCSGTVGVGNDSGMRGDITCIESLARPEEPSGSMRNAEELSTTTAPDLTAMGCKFLGDPSSGAKNRNVYPFKAILGERLDGQFFPTEGELLSSGAGEARRRREATGKFLRSRTRSISMPTARWHQRWRSF